MKYDVVALSHLAEQVRSSLVSSGAANLITDHGQSGGMSEAALQKVLQAEVAPDYRCLTLDGKAGRFAPCVESGVSSSYLK